MGERLAPALERGDVLVLSGELGAGKTAFVRGLARGLGVRHGVKSPSFAIHLRYPGRIPLDHLDLYRVLDPRDLAELGVEDVLGRDAIAAVEWGERLGDLLPPGAITVALADLGGDRRRITVSGTRSAVERLARALAVPIAEGERR